MSPSRIVAVRGTLDVFGLAIVFLVAGMLHMALPSQGTPDVTRTVRDGVGLNSSYYQIPGRKSGTPNVFIPLRGVPTLDRPLGQVGAFYEPRMSGVFGFVDLAQHNGLGYDLEYFLVGRGDGMFLIEATPSINGPAVPEWQQLVPDTTANLRGDFIQSPHVTFPYPAAPFVLNVPHPTNIPGYTPWSECVVLGDGAGNWVAYGSSGHHPGLHVVPLVRQGSQLRFGTGVHWNPLVNLNGVNHPRIPNVHNITADPGSGLMFLCTNSYVDSSDNRLPGHQTFFVLSTRQNHGGSLTNPVVIKDYYGPQNQLPEAHPHDVFIKDGKVLVSLSSEIFQIPGTSLDPRLTGAVDEYPLSGFFGLSFPQSFAKRYLSPRIDPGSALNLSNPNGIASVHSCYKHGATLWLLAESIGHQMGFAAPGLASATNLDAAVGRPNICAVNLNQDAIGVGINAAVYQPAMSVGIPFDTTAGQAARFAWENQQLNLGGMIHLLTQAQAVSLHPSQFPFVTYRILRSGSQPPSNPYPMNPSREMFGIVHHIKGEFATAFMPHYTDGIDLVDLSDPVLGPVILGSSDTSWSQITDGYDDLILVQPPTGPLQPMPAIEAGRINAIHAFHGAYNVWPHHDSGLICIASGVEGAIVMRVDEGWFNRYWLPTSFTMSGSSPVSLDYPHPQIVAENGPPRHGRPFTLRDANRHLLKRVDASGASVAYRYTLLVGQAAPGVRPTALTNGYYQNIVPLQSYGPQFDDVFHFPASRFHTQSERIYFQMLVEEGGYPGGDVDADFVPRNPPVISASRGTWIGVASH